MSEFTGVWFAVKGLNPMFDCFDCQRHTFTFDTSTSKPLHADLKYKVKQDLNCTEGTCIYLDREVHNQYGQDPAQPAHLPNHDNTDPALLGYSDDWYIVSYDFGESETDPNAYILIYYCGCNDAWCGFQGSVLYTRTSTYQVNSAISAQINTAMAGTQIPGYTAVENLCHSSNEYCDGPPKPPSPAAPTPVPGPTPAPGPSTVYKCTVCAHIYNPATDAAPSPAGTKFEDLPDTWLCPICGAPKSAYVKQAGASGEEVWAHTHDEDEVEEVHG
jgi:rubredoxin